MIARTRSKLPAGSCFLFGPCGTGKSTWIDAILPGALKVDLLKESTYVELLGHAERLEALDVLPLAEGLASLAERLSPRP